MDELNTHLVNKNIELKRQLKEITERQSEVLQKQIKSVFYEYEMVEVIEENLKKAIADVETTLLACKSFIVKMKEIKKRRPLKEKQNV